MRLLVPLLALALLAGCSDGTDGTTGADVQRDADDLGAANTPSEEVQEPGADLRFAVVGDFGTGESDQYAVAERMCAWREAHPFDLVITTGDNIYPDGDPAHFESKFFRPMDCLLSEGVAFRSSLGNHDIMTDNGRGELEEAAFGIPARNYVVRRAGVRFVIANSNDFRMRWFRRALKPAEGDRWTIAVFHHPVYSGGTEHGATPGLAGELHRLFVAKGVDLVLNGHDHVYSVSRKKEGVTYVVTGGGGARRYGCGSSPDIKLCLSRLHFLYVRAADDRLRVRAVAKSGDVLHRFATQGIP